MDRDQNEIRDNNDETGINRNAIQPQNDPEPIPVANDCQSLTEENCSQPHPACDNTVYVSPSQAYDSNAAPPNDNTVPYRSEDSAMTQPSVTAPRTVYIPTYTDVPENSAAAPKKKKEKKPVKMSSLVIISILCVIASGAAGFAGTLAAKYVSGNRDSSSNITQPEEIDNSGTDNLKSPSETVIHQVVESDGRTIGTYAEVANNVSDTVVEITTESKTSDSFFWGNYVTQGAGSGVIISADGYIITNNHVVSGASNITVTLSTGEDFTAKLIGTDSDTDIAVIKITPTDTQTEFPFAIAGNSDKLTVGEEVLAVGNPLGELGGTVTNGIVSALSRDVTIAGTSMTLIQTNAAVNPGNSGGGLFNLHGELIGIVNAKTTTTSSGTSVEGIGFAIPINSAIKVCEELIEYGYVRGRVMLGITYFDVEDTYDAFYYRVNALGVYIASSEYNDGLKPYDRIVAIDGNEVTYSADIKQALKGHDVGDKIEVKVVRDGKYVDVEVTLYEYIPTETQQNTDTNSSDR